VWFSWYAEQLLGHLVGVGIDVREASQMAAFTTLEVHFLDELIQSAVFTQPVHDSRFERRLTVKC
jgi:hypothetical protein